MSTRPRHFIIIAGEASGDTHAAHLVNSILEIKPNTRFSGLGGPKMRESGVELYEDLTKVAVVGFTEVLKHFQFFRKCFYLILKKVQEIRPDAVILVDYPGFNLRLAKKLKKLGCKVIYYISPQVWAWKESRVNLIKKCVDKMIVIFPFEKEFYQKHHYAVEYCGHPLLDILQVKKNNEEFLKSVGLSTAKLTIGLLPGSRNKEVDRHFPVMFQAAQMIHKRFPQTQFIVARAPTINGLNMDQQQFTFPGGIPIPIRVVEEKFYDCINACNFCIVASGTATLEVALFNKPMVIVYKTSCVSFLLAKLFVKIPYVGMVNVLAGKKIVPECLQRQANPNHIAKACLDLLTDETKLAEMKSELKKVRDALGEQGASDRAAKEVIKIVS